MQAIRSPGSIRGFYKVEVMACVPSDLHMVLFVKVGKVIGS